VTLRIDQAADYQGDDRWYWQVWLDGTDDELNRVEKVIYTLHETFPQPVQVRADRPSKFRLAASGWGGFRIYAKVIHRDGSTEMLDHDLMLYGEDDRTPVTRGMPAPEKTPEG
jgi:transcription initiation factor IIF auxiliary subunit